MFQVIKSWRDLPAAHRQPKHDGHCRFVHGHNWGFDITFECDQLDENGFVVDVGKLKVVRHYLENLFDHTLLINEDDPELLRFIEWSTLGLCELRVVKNCGMEGLAKAVCEDVQLIFESAGIGVDRKLRVVEVVCWEDNNNRAFFTP